MVPYIVPAVRPSETVAYQQVEQSCSCLETP